MYFDAEIDARKETILEAILGRLKVYPSEYREISGIKASVSNEQANKVKHADGDSQVLADMGDDVRALLDETFDPWKEMADPLYWSNAADNLKGAADKLVDGGVDCIEEGEITSGDITKTAAPIPELADKTRDSISGWWGETANSFKRNHANRFGYIIGLQANLGKALHKAAMAECETYETAQKNLLGIMDDFADAVNNLGSVSGDDVDFAIGVAVAAAGVIGTLTLPVGVLVAVTSTAGGAYVINDFVKKYGDSEGTKATLAGDTVAELWDNLKGHLHTIRVEVQDTEKTLYTALCDVESALAGGAEVGGKKVPAMDLLMPPAPGFVAKVEEAATGENPDKDLDELKDQVQGEVKDKSTDEGDQVEAPGGEYAPEPIDT